MTLVSQAEFARLAEVSRSAIKQAINNGLITAVTEQCGKILIDKEEGLRQYKTNSRRQGRPKAPQAISKPRPQSTELLSWGQSTAKPPTSKPSGNNESQPNDASAKPGALPEYGKSRARSEYEKANLLELKRQELERELLRRDDVTAAWSQAVNITRTRLLGVPSTAKQRIPHLEVEEVELLTTLIREALDELAAGEVKA